ncbi:hypothetical protein BEWA_007130 [Theileria equi strain WA]|uniref:AP2/ERF domain-containing protein n=1 Tax=Theileria equi strain WA TaxID=1537102 RepID=L0B2F5_THEEQ|nr:hypothetical protein BEWA_007130 [Theileria equi strain WA]AFZ81304.1 hypothetical protein BEWA_007130 [Theileria equi strain WA]|eukprot:XP_004830970.1 hypothetical protein BEWA_007130 [Theileria equi strain WA]
MSGDFDGAFYKGIPASLTLGGASYDKAGFCCIHEPGNIIFFDPAHEKKIDEKSTGTGSTDNESATFNDEQIYLEDEQGVAIDDVNVKSTGFIGECVVTPKNGRDSSNVENISVNIEVNDSNKDVTSTGFISLQNDATIGEVHMDHPYIKDFVVFNSDIVTPKNGFAHPKFENPVYKGINMLSAYSTIPSLSDTPSLMSNNGYSVVDYSALQEYPGAIMGFNGVYGYPEMKFYGMEGNCYPVIPNFGLMTNPDGSHIAHMTPNSTIDGASIDDMDELIGPDGTLPPVNKRDPIYTAVSGLKWKAKSKKWVVRWDNPVTNRRVYKYFSGTRYGFMGAHKRAKYYLEFLNASVGRIPAPSSGNPFCRRTEGPPKGKTNKGLLRKMVKPFSMESLQVGDHQSIPSQQSVDIDPRVFPHGTSEMYNSEMNGMRYLGSSAKNPWCTDSFTEQKCSDVQKFYV